ncbi:DUF4156 domain-containing protein [Vibrio sp. TBV020]|uniref:DUF4156 domain-containing protein n=1 Tax=Vibrio sp. TBV020 TaxID=3137398 RepID=UPI0038CD9174
MKNVALIFGVSLLFGCSANGVIESAKGIEIVTTEPNRSMCSYVGEVIGSQGNWLTGDFTSNENLVLGARNELRNEAFKLGANLVYVQESKNTNATIGSLGTTNTTVIGKAYKCKY